MDKLTATLGYSPQKIAVFRAIKLGDLLCAVPAFRALRNAFPEAHIALVSLPWAEEFVRAYPQLFDEFIQFPGWPGLPEQPVDANRTVDFLQQMQGRNWDVVLQLQGNGTLVNAMVSLWGANLIGGYYLPESQSERWAAQAGLFQPYSASAHEAIRHVDFMIFLNIPSQGYELEFIPTEADFQEARKLLSQIGLGSQPIVCIHAGGISGRRWPEEQFAIVAKKLTEQGFSILFTGTTVELAIIATVQAAMDYPSYSIAGQTSLGQLGAILKMSALLISNDTGVAHLAIACQTPSVVIFTSADPAEWGPLNRSLHRVVHESSHGSCNQVIASAMDLVASIKPLCRDN